MLNAQWSLIQAMNAKGICLGGDLFSASVVKAASFPFVANGEAVEDEVRDVSAPHFDGGVIIPPIIRDS